MFVYQRVNQPKNQPAAALAPWSPTRSLLWLLKPGFCWATGRTGKKLGFFGKNWENWQKLETRGKKLENKLQKMGTNCKQLETIGEMRKKIEKIGENHGNGYISLGG